MKTYFKFFKEWTVLIIALWMMIIIANITAYFGFILMMPGEMGIGYSMIGTIILYMSVFIFSIWTAVNVVIFLLMLIASLKEN